MGYADDSGGRPIGAAALKRPSPPALSIGFVLADHFTLSALSLFIDPLRLAADESDRSRPIRCQWAIMAPRPEALRSSCGVAVQRTSAFVDPARFHYIAVVGGLLHAGPQTDPALDAYLLRAAAAGTPLIGLCTGAFVLARLGLMGDRRACVSWFHYRDFVEEFPHAPEPVADQLFLVDGARITCSGGTGVADLAAYLIDKHLGRATAQKAMNVLQLVSGRDGQSAQPHPPVERSIENARVRRALLLMEQHLADPLPIAEVARRLDISTRQLERLFRSVVDLKPATVYRRLRLRHARWLLENTSRSVTDIALDAGFSDCAHLSRQFKDLFGCSPSALRRRSDRPASSALGASERASAESLRSGFA